MFISSEIKKMMPIYWISKQDKIKLLYSSATNTGIFFLFLILASSVQAQGQKNISVKYVDNDDFKVNWIPSVSPQLRSDGILIL